MNITKILAGAFLIASTTFASAEVCQTPKYISHDKGSVVASVLLFPPTAIFATLGQGLRILPGGAEHADRLLCVPNAMVKDVKKHFRNKY